MRRSRLLVAVGSLTAAVLLGSLLADPAREVVHEWRAERAWPEDRAEATAAMDAVALADDYAPIECPADWPDAARCWSTRLKPEQALPDMRAAAGNASHGGAVETISIPSPDTPEGPAATNVTTTLAGTYDPQGFVLIAQRDADERAVSIAEFWLDTTTVRLMPALTAP